MADSSRFHGCYSQTILLIGHRRIAHKFSARWTIDRYGHRQMKTVNLPSQKPDSSTAV
ncbi:hypothetical protein L208DRAFT_1406524 [Tricholoma matsutake]|nr:hypothetical protein L208DRAFT_1406524 [Tricholoma matsutake 945]